MTHWRSGTFWASAIFGWFLTYFALALMVAIFGSDQMTTAEGIIAFVAELVLSLAAGYAYGRQQYERRKPKQVGFPVIIKNGEDTSAG